MSIDPSQRYVPLRPQDYPITGAAFEDAMLDFLAQEPIWWWMCADQFHLWPLHSERLQQALVAWSKRHARGKVHIFGRRLDWIEREAARFMEWRRLFAHQIDARAWPARLPDEQGMPRGLFAERLAVQIAPPQRQEALMARKLDDLVAIKLLTNRLEEVWGSGQPALPAYRLGL